VIYAAFWIRVAAYLIDYLLIFLIMVCVGVVGALFAIDSEVEKFAPLISIFMMWLFFTLFESGRWQATPGKRLLKIRVTDMNGNRISFGKAAGRNLARFLSGLIFGIGYIMAAFTEKKQALHDQIASTLVLKGGTIIYPHNENLGFINNNDSTHVIHKDLGKLRSQKWVMAGFDSSGHVVRLSFDFDDPKLLADGIIIGRDSRESDIHISDNSISRKHARLLRIGNDVWIEDMGSTNGISIAGRPLSIGEKSLLTPNGVITLGGIIFTMGKG